jgi:hypothetical protein
VREVAAVGEGVSQRGFRNEVFARAARTCVCVCVCVCARVYLRCSATSSAAIGSARPCASAGLPPPARGCLRQQHGAHAGSARRSLRRGVRRRRVPCDENCRASAPAPARVAAGAPQLRGGGQRRERSSAQRAAGVLSKHVRAAAAVALASALTARRAPGTRRRAQKAQPLPRRAARAAWARTATAHAATRRTCAA